MEVGEHMRALREAAFTNCIAPGFRNTRKKAKMLVTGIQTLLLGLRDDRRRQATVHVF
jgi:hypothetical protein